MKKLFSILFTSLIFIFTSCDNPLFISATKLYEVTFSTNGGSAVESVRTDCVKELPYTQKADSTFLGWHLSSDFSDSAAVFPLEITKDTTLYASWQQNYTVSFETNGGDQIESYKTGIISEIPNTSRTNYIFGGWYLTSDFSGEPVNFPFTVSKPTTLYAKWLATYNVSFVTNGGSEISSYRTAIIESSPETLRDGYSFAGWFSDAGLTNSVTFPLTMLEDTVLYAKWLEVHTVTFETNGGTAIPSIVTGYIESAPVTTKSDFGFGGWYLDSEFASENKVTFPYTVTSDVTLYAKWTAVQCTVTYFANGASGGSVPASVSIDKGSIYTVAGNTGNLEKTGYAFIKWNVKADGSGQGYSAGDSLTVTGDITLYAQWARDYSSWEKQETRTSMIYIGEGSFVQGSNAEHIVTMSDFYIGQYEITYELWKEVVDWAAEQNGKWNIGIGKKGVTTNDEYSSWEPVTTISWYQAITWCNAYSKMKGLEPYYYTDYNKTTIYSDYTAEGFPYRKMTANGYRLPTESEWEYAAKGGPEQRKYLYSGSNTLSDVAWYSSNSNKETHPVGTKTPNSLNIYDMSGNVCEWCGTSNYTYSTDAQANPNFWAYYNSTGNFYCPIHRGGSYNSSNLGCEATYRTYSSEATFTSSIIGFRVARNAQ